MSSVEPQPDAAPARRVAAIVLSRSEIPGQAERFLPAETIRRVRSSLTSEDGGLAYKVVFEDGHPETLAFEELLNSRNGAAALDAFENASEQYDTTSSEGTELESEGDSERDSQDENRRSSRVHSVDSSSVTSSLDDLNRGPDALSSFLSRRRSQRASTNSSGIVQTRSGRSAKRAHFQQLSVFPDTSADDDDSSEDSQAYGGDGGQRTKRRRLTRGMPQRPIRQSERATRTQKSMREVGLDIVYQSSSSSPPEHGRPASKPAAPREIFKSLPKDDPFRTRHVQQCDTCGTASIAEKGELVYCQGCSLSYHRQCIANKSKREHTVTKISPDSYVLQCRRCTAFPRRKEATAPDHSLCAECHEPGRACRPFRDNKSKAPEQQGLEASNGADLAVTLDADLVNNAENVLFRCLSCFRAFHYHHLKSKTEAVNMDGVEDELIAQERLREYSRGWICLDCDRMPAKVSGIVAWRPVNPDSYVPGTTVREVDEDQKEYLIKWSGLSYFRAQWMPGAWVWSVTAATMRLAFAKRDMGQNLATMNAEDAIPEDYLRIDIVLDVRYTSYVDTNAEEVSKARVREVDEALIKYKGLGYEDAVWERVPGPQDGDRWKDFLTAYEDWVMGRYIRIPNTTRLKGRLEKVREQGFAELEKKKQPDSLVGGELMNYQLDGLNWIYYKWFTKSNAILADEMGLGKTIQVIGFFATLVQDHSCFPFLVVVPNSTCPNWRREIKRWAPSLRVVAYYGTAASRNMAYQYELYPNGSKELRCHVVITSYDAAASDASRQFLRSVNWQGLIVDEGQRLKNDGGLLYGALSALKAPFKLLLTGTPLQNNARELFNLLQFLDETKDAAALEQQFAELTQENVPDLHNMIRPFFLRRTKAQVLTFLPPMAQIILPVSMSLVQRKLYMSILAKNPELIRAIFDPSKELKKAEKANLNNILMQLRKCLCHPFVYSKEIEDRKPESAAVLHRNLVEASSKLQLLEVLLPKLKDRGHRVLIFSQFLDMLDIVEDFLDGLALEHLRLDGNVSSLEKQKRIDEYNAPESSVFAFVLSTRAGGVGINLATADTVIILDPDFNPHQDIQALSRAHRIGQKNKVLCFQLMTRSSAEEKIVQVGRRKMALDHVIVEQMDADEDKGIEVESILRHGVADLMDDSIADIKYDGASVDKLLDRSQIENTKAGEDNSAESQFSFARVWANDTASLADSLDSSDDEDMTMGKSGWEKILQERERLAEAEAATRQQILGRGRRARQAVDYSGPGARREEEQQQQQHESSSDTDFQAQQSDSDDSKSEHAGGDEPVDVRELAEKEAKPSRSGIVATAPQPSSYPPPVWQRSNVVWPVDYAGFNAAQGGGSSGQPAAAASRPPRPCMVCKAFHAQGYCPLKLAPVEHCNLCGLAHFGVARTCPHIKSETQVAAMLQALKNSPEQRELVDLASRYLRGVKGTLVQAKKHKAEKTMERAAELAGAVPNPGPAGPHGASSGPPSVSAGGHLSASFSQYPWQPSGSTVRGSFDVFAHPRAQGSAANGPASTPRPGPYQPRPFPPAQQQQQQQQWQPNRQYPQQTQQQYRPSQYPPQYPPLPPSR